MGRNKLTKAQRRAIGKKAWEARRKKVEGLVDEAKDKLKPFTNRKAKGSVRVVIPKPAEETKSEFQDDFRKSNPGLHMLHTKWAVRHMTMIRRMMEILRGESNIKIVRFVVALDTEMEGLIKESAAWSDAKEILSEVVTAESRIKGIRYDEE